MYRKRPDAAQMAENSLTLDDFEADFTAEVWPDTDLPIRVFLAMSTQWNMGPNGPCGLVYASLPEVWRRLKVPPECRSDAFEDVRIMEIAALDQMRQD